jgi:adenosylmethionine-8-amino-7-oxononanoate aminotransferase
VDDSIYGRQDAQGSVLWLRYEQSKIPIRLFSNTTTGSEACEAAIKIVTQYFRQEISPPQPERTLFIAREYSYHGATSGALDMSGFESRKNIFRPILPNNMHTVPACHPYRNQSGKTEAEYIEWHKMKLIEKIEELGSKKVAALILEPVVGAVSTSSAFVLLTGLWLNR